MSTSAPPEIRSASVSERERVLATITAAFVTDPVARFALPEPQAYLAFMATVAEGMGGPAFENDSAFVAPGFSGAALWLPPGIHGDPSESESLMGEVVPEDHIGDLAATLEAMAAHHPDEPHWYLPLVGVDPIAQGRGLGAALMKHALERIDAEGAVAYLESSNPRNIGLYQRFGFEVVGEIRMGRAPLVTPMVRAAARASAAG